MCLLSSNCALGAAPYGKVPYAEYYMLEPYVRNGASKVGKPSKPRSEGGIAVEAISSTGATEGSGSSAGSGLLGTLGAAAIAAAEASGSYIALTTFSKLLVASRKPATKQKIV